jgi:hypothetical protein
MSSPEVNMYRPLRPCLSSLFLVLLGSAPGCSGPQLDVKDVTVTPVADGSVSWTAVVSNGHGNPLCRASAVTGTITLETWTSEDAKLNPMTDRPRGGWWLPSPMSPGVSFSRSNTTGGAKLIPGIDNYLIIQVVDGAYMQDKVFARTDASMAIRITY